MERQLIEDLRNQVEELKKLTCVLNQERIIHDLKKQVEELQKRAGPRYFYDSKQISDFPNGGVHFAPSNLVSVPKYNVQLDIPFDLQFLQVTFHIPFVGNPTSGSRNRIILNFDDTHVSDATKFVNTSWELHDVTLTGLVPNVQHGQHSLSIWVLTDSGNLNIPHYNVSLCENTVNPKLFANYYYFGIEK